MSVKKQNSIGQKSAIRHFVTCSLKKETEGAKSDEAAKTAVALEVAGQVDDAQEIYRRILVAHPEHVLAKEKME